MTLSPRRLVLSLKLWYWKRQTRTEWRTHAEDIAAARAHAIDLRRRRQLDALTNSRNSRGDRS